MYRNLIYYSLGLASTTLTASKVIQYQKWRTKQLATSIALITLAQSKIHSSIRTSIIEKLEINRPCGWKKYLIYFVRFVELGLIFLPSILLLPLMLFEKTS